ncbi:hypothetical protein PRIPAC_83924 [Pristionchus pacificus]|uniref:Uncharacterized protein n=1 Tax=Pristionchus pacificus TaxID=54126 RepID=A0A2A6BUF2_PRIPA|nr:hypothetical protein PRIPAC_83924 [Pristionchus pacificus]|eukprot:PDM69381.1 hypothetical protein PRIPAC_47683 [Pristionchus pacificus]
MRRTRSETEKPGQGRMSQPNVNEQKIPMAENGPGSQDARALWEVRVTGRHITKIVSVKKKKDEGKIKEQVDELRAQVQQIVEEHPDIYIWNCDQTGMVKEAHGKRTLARKGVRKVVCVAQSVGATTSSITLLPIIGMDGYVKPKIFVQLGEPGGKLPKKGCYRDSTLDIAVATSHIMSKLSAIQFYKEVLFSGFVPPKLLLILDSWPAFKDHDAIRQCAPPNCQLFIVNIPPGGTAMCQPADISFNHQLKGIQKRLKSIILAKKIDYRISQRDNLLKFSINTVTLANQLEAVQRNFSRRLFARCFLPHAFIGDLSLTFYSSTSPFMGSTVKTTPTFSVLLPLIVTSVEAILCVSHCHSFRLCLTQVFRLGLLIDVTCFVLNLLQANPLTSVLTFSLSILSPYPLNRYCDSNIITNLLLPPKPPPPPPPQTESSS